MKAIRKKHPPAKEDTPPTGDDETPVSKEPEMDTQYPQAQAGSEKRRSTYNTRKEGGV